jgi:hypothetical protein
MKVYSLLGFIDYEGSELVGVFGSVEDVLRCVESGKESWWYDQESWWYDQMGYVESEVGITVVGDKYEPLDVDSLIVYVEFQRGR